MNMKKLLAVIMVMTFFAAALEESAFARAGRSGGFGGRSSTFGNRGSRTYNAPARPAPKQNQYQGQQAQRPASPASPSPFGGFWRGLAGGVAGGFLGALLFRGLGFGGYGLPGGGFGGIGIIDILLLGGLAFIIYKIVRSRRRASVSPYAPDPPVYDHQPIRDVSPAPMSIGDTSAGLSQIRQFDLSFDENRFKETVTDMFFKVQAAWMNRDIESSRSLFAPELLELMRGEIAQMKTEGRINRLENIAMRGVEITEAWQEQGKDYLTVEITANVLDYVTDESGRLIEGSRTDPIKFMEYWTFVRAIGTGPWQLSAIQQAE